MGTIKAGNIRKGGYILFKGQPCLVTKTDFMSPGKGSAHMRVRLRNVQTTATQEFTYKSGESVEELEVNSVKLQYLYHDSDEVVFMNERTYEQVGVPATLLEDQLDLLMPSSEVYVMFYEGKAIGVSLPPKIKLLVTDAQDAAAGNTVGQAKKEVTLETGLKVMAPVFVKKGDSLMIDTTTKQYASRA